MSQQVVAGQVEDEGREDEGESGRDPQPLRAPHRVSKEEREIHELTHTHRTVFGADIVCSEEEGTRNTEIERRSARRKGFRRYQWTTSS